MVSNVDGSSDIDSWNFRLCSTFAVIYKKSTYND